MVEVPNASFESGTGQPAAWTLSGGEGQWIQGGQDGPRAVTVTGTGEDSNYWYSGPLKLEPSSVYLLRFAARAWDTAGGGTPITGLVFCNRDLGAVPNQWTSYTSVFVTPAQIDPETARLRFGQWHMKGSVAFDRVELFGVDAVYAGHGDLALGDGERVRGNAYEFKAPFQGDSRNQSRPLARQQCLFNTYRWVFTGNSEVVFKHAIGNRHQLAASVEVGIGYYDGGELVVEASQDGKAWRELGRLREKTGRTFPIPGELLPASEVWVRLEAAAQPPQPNRDFAPGAFQVDAYGYRATFDGEPAEAQGATRFVAVLRSDPRLKVRLNTFGDCVPGGENVLVARIENVTKEPVASRPTLTFDPASQNPAEFSAAIDLKPGGQLLRLPYNAPDAGLHLARFTLGPGNQYEAESTFRVADLYCASYGECLSQSTDKVGIWWASSGWKISQTRPVPEARGEWVEVRAAANEAEAAQLVIRPSVDLNGFRAEAGPLRGPAGAVIPADRVEVLRVRYVTVAQPTDAVGVAAPWPDPLPPFQGPINLVSGRNQPLWVRVTVPRGAPAGAYTGSIRLDADNYRQEIPLRVVVCNFTLPDRMTCTSGFGFSPGRVFAYQKLGSPDLQRAVLEKYWADFSAHHISPYDPAPLDPFKVTWPGSVWIGGRRDRSEHYAGESSLFLNDQDPHASVECGYANPVTIPEKGFRLRFMYKTNEAGQPFLVTFDHLDATGQWMSGRNNDIRVEGNGTWQPFDHVIDRFPEGARAVRFTLRPDLWAEDGSTTGTAWFDEVSIQDAGTGQELVTGGGFEPLTEKDLAPTFDWAAWDAAMTRAFEVYHFSMFRTPIEGMGGGTFHSRVEPSLLGYEENTPEYKAAFTAYCRTLQEHLREKGWLRYAYVYWFDEPEPRDYPFVMNGFRKLKEAAPDIGRMLTEQVEPELVGGPNIWCPVTPEYNHDRAEARRAEGERFWWYVCTGPKEPYCTLFLDHPAVELRVWLWQTWQRRINGILVWETNYWTSTPAYPDPNHPQNPYEDTMSWTEGYDTPVGTRLPWGNGDGRFIYPPEAAADGHPDAPVLDGPVDSIRWEMLRDGIEDYEYLVILKRLIDERSDKLTPEKRQEYTALLTVPETITADMTLFTKDPRPIEQRRDAIARAIEELSQH
jgi:hypothetical protein